MLIGEAPGAEEDATGRPFIGTAGKELDSLIVLAGHKRSDVFIANGTKCRPPGNRTPLTTEANSCFPYLAEEISTVNPRVILCLGGSALKTLTGKEAVAANRGRPIPAKPSIRIGDAQIFVTYHPAAVMHNRNPEEMKRIREAIVQDMQLAFSMADGGRGSPKDHKRYLLPPGSTPRQFKDGIDGLMGCDALVCDLEWTALEDRHISWPWSKGAELYTVSFSGRVGDNIRTFAFAWPPPAEAEEDLKAFFECKPLIWHNALADLNWLSYYNLPNQLAGDTMVLAYLMDEEQRLALEQLAPLYTDVKPGWKIGPWRRPPETEEGWLELLGYNAEDTYATLKLNEALLARLETLPDYERDGIKRVYYKLMLPIIPTLVSMAVSGIPMDEEGVEREIENSIRREREITEKIAEIVGCNPTQAAALAGSPTQALHYLQEAYDLEIETSRKDDLSGYEDTYPIINFMQKYRWEHNKVQGTYLVPWHSLLKEQQDHRLHSVYRTTFARTGRTSAEIEKGGSLQLMPRNTDDRELRIRNLVKAPPGRIIISADYSQIEMRVMAWFAGDKVMTQLFKEDADLHKATAAFIKAQPIPLATFWQDREGFMSAVTKDERQGAKGVNFGLIFGLQPDGLMEYSRNTYKVDMSFQDAVDAHTAYFKMYSDIKAYHEYCRNVIFPRGYTDTPFGRFRRHLEDPNKAINTPVQATASDMTLLAMHNIDVRLKMSNLPAQVIGFVHDSVLAEADEDWCDRIKGLIKEEMENLDLRELGVASLPVPLKADVVAGATWGDAS